MFPCGLTGTLHDTINNYSNMLNRRKWHYNCVIVTSLKLLKKVTFIPKQKS